MKLFLFLLTILFYTAHSQVELTLTELAATPNSVGSTSSIKFKISKKIFGSFQVPQTGVIELSYPADFGMGSPTCTATRSGDGTVTLASTLDCEEDSGKIIIETNLAQAESYYSITITVQNFINPSVISYTGGFTLQIKDATDTVTAQAVDLKKLTLAKGVMQSCEISDSTSDIVGEDTQLTFTLNTNNKIPALGSIEIQTPLWDTDEFEEDYYYANANTVCSSGSANVDSGVSCTVSTTGLMRIQNGFPSTDATGEIIILANMMKTPLSLADSSSFSLQTKDSSGNVIEECTGMTFKVSTPGDLTNWATVAENSQILESGFLNMEFENTNPIDPPGSIQIVFPPQMSISDPLEIIFSSPAALVVVEPTIVGNTATFTNIVSSSRVPRSSTVQLAVRYVTLPSSKATTDSFQITTLSNGKAVDRATTGFTFTTLNGKTLTINSVTPDLTAAGSQTAYTFSLTLASALTDTAAIRIIFPIDIEIEDTCTLQAISGNVDGGLSCSSTSATRTMILSDLFLAGVADGATIQFKVDLITNPKDTEPSGTFTIQTIYDDSDLTSIVDENFAYQTNFVTSGVLALAQISITPDSDITSASTKYTFGFQGKNEVPQNGDLWIRVPKTGFTFPSAVISLIEASLDDVSNINPSATVEIDQTDATYNYIKVLDAFDQDYAASTNFEFSLSSIKNPATIEDIADFKFETFNQNGFSIDASASFSFGVTQPHEFNFIRITPETLQNGQTGYYKFEITIAQQHFDEDIILIEFPPELDLNLLSATVVTAESVAGVTVASFTQPGADQAKITLDMTTSPIAVGSKIVLEVNAVTNNVITGTIQGFTISSMDANEFKRAESIEDPGLETEVAILTFPDSNLEIDILTRSATNVIYTFTMDHQNDIPDDGYIEIDFPALFTVPNPLSCENAAGISSFACSRESDSRVRITGEFASSSLDPLQFRILGMTNPSASSSGSFVVSSYLVTDTVIDRISQDLKYNADCSLPCKTCEEDMTSCLSCFTDGSSEFDLLNEFECVKTCPTGKTDYDGVCTVCNPKCTKCTNNDPDECTECSSSPTEYFLSGTTCTETCPPGTYQERSTYVCADCSDLCESCTEFDKCTSCPVGQFLYNEGCYNECPENITVVDGTNCEACHTNCTTCETSPDTCNSCAANFYLFGTTCLGGCPDGFYFNLDTLECGGCVGRCDTCENSATSCTSCNEGYLYEDDCVDECPVGYFEQVNNECQECFTGCDKCSDGVTCEQCESPKLLQEGLCVDSCSVGKVSNGTNCIECAEGCTQCSGTISNCQECATNFYLSGSSCVEDCPEGFYNKADKTCAECHSSCTTCNGATSSNCESCSNGDFPYLTPSNQCDDSCPVGYYADDGSNKCEKCNSACSSCNGTAISQCLGCNEEFSLYGTTCVSICPSSITVEVAGNCQNCESPCKTCSGTIKSCDSCIDDYLLVTENRTCVQECPDGSYSYQGECNDCSSECLTCQYSSTSCLACANGLFALNYECVESCPSLEYKEENGVCVELTLGEAADTLSESGVLPFPFLICSILALILVIVAKASSKETVISSNVVALMGIIEFASWVTLTVLLLDSYEFSIAFTTDTLDLVLIFVGLAFNYIYNSINIIYMCYLKKKDDTYRKWLKEKANNRATNILLTFSTITSFKLFKLSYNRLFGADPLSANMSNVKRLKPLHFITILSLITSSGFIIAGIVFLLKKGLNADQLTITAFEIPVITILLALFVFCDISKPKIFYPYYSSSKLAKVQDENTTDQKELLESRKRVGTTVSPEKIDVSLEKDDVSRSKIGLLDEVSKAETIEEDIVQSYVKSQLLFRKAPFNQKSPPRQAANTDFENLLKDELFMSPKGKDQQHPIKEIDEGYDHEKLGTSGGFTFNDESGADATKKDDKMRDSMNLVQPHQFEDFSEMDASKHEGKASRPNSRERRAMNRTISKVEDSPDMIEDSAGKLDEKPLKISQKSSTILKRSSTKDREKNRSPEKLGTSNSLQKEMDTQFVERQPSKSKLKTQNSVMGSGYRAPTESLNRNSSIENNGFGGSPLASIRESKKSSKKGKGSQIGSHSTSTKKSCHEKCKSEGRFESLEKSKSRSVSKSRSKSRSNSPSKRSLSKRSVSKSPERTNSNNDLSQSFRQNRFIKAHQQPEDVHASNRYGSQNDLSVSNPNSYSARENRMMASGISHNHDNSAMMSPMEQSRVLNKSGNSSLVKIKADTEDRISTLNHAESKKTVGMNFNDDQIKIEEHPQDNGINLVNLEDAQSEKPLKTLPSERQTVDQNSAPKLSNPSSKFAVEDDDRLHEQGDFMYPVHDDLEKSIGQSRQFGYEETPSAFNDMNQRYDDSQQYSIKEQSKGEFMTVLTDEEGNYLATKVNFPQINNRTPVFKDEPILPNTNQNRIQNHSSMPPQRKSTKKGKLLLSGSSKGVLGSRAKSLPRGGGIRTSGSLGGNGFKYLTGKSKSNLSFGGGQIVGAMSKEQTHISDSYQNSNQVLKSSKSTGGKKGML